MVVLLDSLQRRRSSSLLRRGRVGSAQASFGVRLGLDVSVGRVGGGSVGRESRGTLSSVSSVYSVVGNELGCRIDFGCRSFPEQRAVEEVEPSQRVILLDDLGVDVRKPEEHGQYRDDEGGHGNGDSNGASGKFVEFQFRGTLVN